MKTLKAIQTINGATTLIDVDAPRLETAQMIVQPLFVGICGTDIQIIRHQRPDPATILGHEGIARILKTSNAVKDLQPGGYVVFNPVDPTNQNQILGHNTPGLLQQQYSISQHAIKNNLVVPLPSDANPILGALVEPLGTVIYGHTLVSQVVKQSVVAIAGAGAIGIMHALYAKSQGYKKVLLINTSRRHLDWCVQRGILNKENTFLDSENLSDQVLAATQGLGVDAVYMCTSRSNALAALKRALRYVKAGGCVDLVGGIKDGDAINELPGIKDLNAIRRANFCGIPPGGYIETTKNNKGELVHLTGHRGTSLQHFKSAIKNLRDHEDTFRKIVSHIISPEACVDLFNDLAKGHIEEFYGSPYIKAIVDLSIPGNQIKNN